MVNLIHQGQQPSDFTFGDARARKPAQIVTRQISNQPPFVFTKRHAARHQQLQVFGLHAQPPARLTTMPCPFSISTMRSQWSPCTSITPSLTVPPEPQAVLSCLPNAVSAVASSASPFTRVT